MCFVLAESTRNLINLTTKYIVDSDLSKKLDFSVEHFFQCIDINDFVRFRQFSELFMLRVLKFYFYSLAFNKLFIFNFF